jgi:hypothetical protein
MIFHARSHFVLTLGVGVAAGVLGTLALRGERPRSSATPETSTASPAARREDDSLMAANTRLVSSLQECNRRLAQIEARPPVQVEAAAPASASAAPSASAPAPAPVASTDRRGPYSRDDWERFAQQGIVPYRIPCMNEAAPSATDREADRPAVPEQHGEAVREMYASSNRRVLAHMAPLCASAVGEAAERLGPGGCLRAIIDYARRDNADRLRQTLVRVAEISSGKLAPPPPSAGTDPIEALLLGVTAEAKALHTDFAVRFGTDEADRMFNARGVCSERGFVTAATDGR